jgi:hypothetical protein
MRSRHENHVYDPPQRLLDSPPLLFLTIFLSDALICVRVCIASRFFVHPLYPVLIHSWFFNGKKTITMTNIGK